MRKTSSKKPILDDRYLDKNKHYVYPLHLKEHLVFEKDQVLRSKDPGRYNLYLLMEKMYKKNFANKNPLYKSNQTKSAIPIIVLSL